MKDFLPPSIKLATACGAGLLALAACLLPAAARPAPAAPLAAPQPGAAPAAAQVKLVRDPAQPDGLGVIPMPAVQIEARVLELTRQMAQRAARDDAADPAGAADNRWEVTLGAADSRLRLAPCGQVDIYVPNGIQLWGRSRVGLRCQQGAVHWNVYLPVTVRVFGRGVVPAVNLLPGARIEAADLRMAEVDLAAERSPAILSADAAIGREVAHGLPAGQSLRQDSLKPRRYFSVGDPVHLVVKGPGFSVDGTGEALTPGDDDQCARIRTDAGRIVCGRPIGERLVELLP